MGGKATRNVGRCNFGPIIPNIELRVRDLQTMINLFIFAKEAIQTPTYPIQS